MPTPRASTLSAESESTPLLSAAAATAPSHSQSNISSAASTTHPTSQSKHPVDPPSYHAPSTHRVRFQLSAPSQPTLPSYSAFKYGNYASEAEYLSALRAWVEEKDFVDVGDTGVLGFYGTTTAEGYIQRSGGGARSRRDRNVDKEGKMEGEGKGKGERDGNKKEGRKGRGEGGVIGRAKGDNAAEGRHGEGVDRAGQRKEEKRGSILGGWLARRKAKQVDGA